MLQSCDAPPFACTTTFDARGEARVRLRGELDIATCPLVRRSLDEALRVCPVTVVDLRGLAFMDTTGVHTFLDATADARRLSRILLLIAGPPSVQAVFALTGQSDAVVVA